jgi:hypothetical protein
VVGDWMGSMYGINGSRSDLFLFLDRYGRYERTVRMEPDHDRRDTGRWEYEESDRVLELISDTPDESDRMCRRWSVLSVTGCEDSNVLLVLRPLILGSRILPVVLYRVHCNDRGYGTNWEQRLA